MQVDLFSLPDVKSPLGYPGGKRKLWPYLEGYLPSNLKQLVSPFMGRRGYRIIMYKQRDYSSWF